MLTLQLESQGSSRGQSLDAPRWFLDREALRPSIVSESSLGIPLKRHTRTRALLLSSEPSTHLASAARVFALGSVAADGRDERINLIIENLDQIVGRLHRSVDASLINCR